MRLLFTMVMMLPTIIIIFLSEAATKYERDVETVMRGHRRKQLWLGD